MNKKTQTGPRKKAGLDIGSSYVKLLEVLEDGGRIVLSGFGMKSIAGQPRDAVVRCIRSLASESRATAKEAVISVSGPQVQARFISMPRMKDEELAGAVTFEAEKFMPLNIDECVVGFHVLEKHDRDNKLDLALVAAKKDYVEDRIRLAEEAGFAVSVVDVDPFAVSNAFIRSFPNMDAEKTSALLNIGAVSTNLSILKGARVYFVRNISLGGNDFDQAISRAMGLDAKSAESLKMNPQDRMQEVAGCVKAIFSSLVDEARLSFGYYENQFGRTVDNVYLSGGGSGLCGMEDMMREAFGSKPVAWDPIGSMDTSGVDAGQLAEVKRYFAVAAGLVLR